MESKNIYRQNYQTDFTSVFRFPEGSRPSYAWRLTFSVKSGLRRSLERFVASFDGERYINCRPTEQLVDGVRIEFKRHGLGVGRMWYELHAHRPNDLFADGMQATYAPYEMEIELWDGPSDDSPIPDAMIPILQAALRGFSAYELAVANGYAGSEPQWLASLQGEDGHSPVLTSDHAGHIYSDAKLLSDAIPQAIDVLSASEQDRASAEQLRVQSETVRDEAETRRQSAESARVSEERIRSNTETVRQRSESSRISAEKNRQDTTSAAIRATTQAIDYSAVQTARAASMADHPPVIVEVAGNGYWAFWDEQMQDYATSTYRSDDGLLVESVTGADVALEVVGGRIYLCGNLASLDLLAVETSEKLSIVRFASGAVATQFSYPESLLITGWSIPQANTSYSIFIWQGAATIVYDE